MKKLFKKSIACLIAVLMVVSSMPFTALTANAAEIKTDISVWDASNASLTEHGDRFVFADGTTNQSFTGIEWGSQALNSGYASLDNATGSFGVISSSSIGDEWSDITMDSSGFEARGINGSHWSFSAKFAFTDKTNTNDNVTIFGIGTSKTYDYSHANPHLTKGQAADIVDLRKDGRLFIGDASVAAATLTTDDFVSTDATKPITVTVEYNNGSLSLSVGKDIKYTTTVTNTELFEKGVSNYFVGAPAQVYSGGNFSYYAGASGGTARQNGDKCIFGFNLYSLSASVSVDLPTIKNAIENTGFAPKTGSKTIQYNGTDVGVPGVLYTDNTYRDANDHVWNLSGNKNTNVKAKVMAGAGKVVYLYSGDKSVIQIPCIAEYKREGDTLNRYKINYLAPNGVNSTDWAVVDKWELLSAKNSWSLSTSSKYSGDGIKYISGDPSNDVTGFSSDKGEIETKDPMNYRALIKYTGTLTFDDNGKATLTNPKFKTSVDGFATWALGFKSAHYDNVDYTSTTKNTIAFGDKNNNNLPVYTVFNYKPMVDKLKVAQTKYNEVKANESNYTPASVLNFYNAVKGLVDYNPNNYDFSTDNAFATATTAMNTAIANYDNADAGLTRQYEIVFNYYGGGNASTAYYTAGSTVTVPETNTASNYDETQHYTYYWPSPATVSGDATYTEKRTGANHSFTDETLTDATCTENGSTKRTCACGYSYTDYTIPAATGHTWREDAEVPATCTTTGTYAGKTCTECGATEGYGVIAIDENAHKWGNWTKVDSTNHRRVCEYNNDHTQTEAHDMDGNTCTKCHYIAKVTIRFVDENDGFISSAEYNIGADVVVPELPEQTEVYVGDNQHKVTTYSWNEIPQATASQAATYKRVKTESTVACSNELMQKYETYDTWHCTVCRHEYNRDVTDMSALKANITALEAAINVDDAAYKYDASALATAKETLDEAKAYVANDNNRYASIQDVNAMSTSVGTAYTELTENGLAKYSQTFIIRKDDGNGKTEDIATFTNGYENLAYGSTVEFNDYTIPTINDGSTLTGLPMYAVYKWVKIVNGVEQKLAATDVQISDVVKGETTYICYVLDFKATDETQKTTRVRYLDKSGNTIKFDTATVGEPYTRKDTSIAPIIPYYNCTGWEPLFGDETNVGTRELVYRAIYTFNETEANRCTIVGLPGVYVNGTTGTPGYTAYYDEKIQLTGADKYAYANADGSIIAPINESYIFAPHLNGVDKTIYITKVETPITEAKSIVTGVFTTHADPTYNYLVINAQYYLPEGAKAVEAGAVIGKYNNADSLKIGSALKVVSDTQGDNHEYSLQMSYSKGKTGTLYARSYLIYVDSNGDTQTVYSDDITTCNLD